MAWILSAPFVAAADPVPAGPRVTRTFSVADLVIPIPDVGDDPGATSAKRQSAAVAQGAERLKKLVMTLVRPQSWDVAGGGKLAFFEQGHALSVTHSAAAVAEVDRVLEALRRLHDLTVAVEVRVVSIPAGMGDKLPGKGGNEFLSEKELQSFLESLQGRRDAAILQMPKVTTFDGQAATIRVGEQRVFVTGGELVKAKGQTVFVPKQTTADLGDTFRVRGSVSADRKYVSLDAGMTRTTLVGEVVKVPVTTTITPVFEGGSQGKPIPFTQFLEAPEFDTRKVERSVIVPDGGTVVIGGWKYEVPAPPPPAITKIPYIKRISKRGDEARQLDVIVLATVRVVRTEADSDAKSPRSPQP